MDEEQRREPVDARGWPKAEDRRTSAGGPGPPAQEDDRERPWKAEALAEEGVASTGQAQPWARSPTGHATCPSTW